ncbi:hypothetical protein KKB44_00990 [Candidatus Micrarchaeota archaeon]|nr:hypothetical protein [Candidatus Micrarchaeota archaeon]
MRSPVIFLLLGTLVFADIGPSPSQPPLTVIFTQNSQVYDGPITLLYHCSLPVLPNSGGPMSDREVNMSCSQGVCTNDFWFYKFNPCFDNGEGYFSYQTSNQQFRSTNPISFNDSGALVTIDIDDAYATTSPQEPPPGIPCLSFLLLPMILLFSRIQ